MFKKDKPPFYYVSLQESEKELEEAEEYKEARLVLDSVKLEAWRFSVQGVFLFINLGIHSTVHRFWPLLCVQVVWECGSSYVVAYLFLFLI